MLLTSRVSETGEANSFPYSLLRRGRRLVAARENGVGDLRRVGFARIEAYRHQLGVGDAVNFPCF